MARKTHKQILDEFISVHGDRYDYSLVHYEGSNVKVKVGCRVHGVFQVTPQHHARSRSGCRKCYADSQKMTLETFKDEAIRQFGDHYDYSTIIDFSLSGDVTLRCKIHDTLLTQNARNHYRGHHGCKACLGSMLSGPASSRGTVRNREELTALFIEQARAVHGDGFDYSRFVYTSARSKGSIVCPKGHFFVQSPSNHLKGQGCPQCVVAEMYQDSLKRSFWCKKQYWRALKRRQAGLATEIVYKDGYIRNDKRINPVRVGEVEYPNHAALFRAHEPAASPASVSRWIYRGMEPEQALVQKTSSDGTRGIIYRIRNLRNGKVYVGLTGQPLPLRWLGHLEAARRGDIRSPDSLHQAIRTFGEESFLCEEIDQGVKGQDLERKERDWIAKLNCRIPHGMNICAGGTSGGSRPCPATVDGIRFDSIGKAAAYVSHTRRISLAAAKWRIRHGKVDLKSSVETGLADAPERVPRG